MKKLLLVLSLFVFVGTVIFTGCAKDGEDGKAFLSYDWDYYTDWYDDNNSATPESNGGIDQYVDYEVSPGSYTYEYGCSDGNGNAWTWEGTYTITVNPGESGSMFTDGSNGVDNFFRFNLYGNEPQFYLLKLDKVNLTKLNMNTMDMSAYDKTPAGDVVTEIQNSVNGTMIIKKQMYKLTLK
jgi:hypothetical protein